jgi:hypothetical protein
MDRGGNYWTLFTPGIWKVLHAILHYCARGEMENRIKECPLDLFAGRTSAATMRQSVTPVVRLVGLRAALRAAPDWPGLHPVRPGQLRQHPAETAEDRRAGQGQCAPDPSRHGLGVSLSA